MNVSGSLTQVESQVDKGIQGSAFAARETHKNVGIAKVRTPYTCTIVVDVRTAGNVLCAHGNIADGYGCGVVVRSWRRCRHTCRISRRHSSASTRLLCLLSSNAMAISSWAARVAGGLALRKDVACGTVCALRGGCASTKDWSGIVCVVALPLQ